MNSINEQSGRKSPKRASRWFWIALSTLTLMLVVLVGTPVLIERLAEQWLEQHGGERVEVQDVDFNPFTGILRLDDVTIEVQDRTPLSFDTAELNLAWLPLFSKHIQVQSIELTGFRMVIRNEDMLRVGGIQLPTGQQETATDQPSDESTPWAAGIDMLGLHDFTLVYKDRNIGSTVYIDSLQLSNLTQWTPEQPARLDYRGHINDAPLTLKATLAPFSATPVYKGSLSIKDLQLSAFESLAQPALEKLAGLVSLGGDFSIGQNDQTLKIQHEGTLSIEDIAVSHPSARVTNQASKWTGTTDLTIALDGDTSPQLRNQGKLYIGKLSVELPSNKLKVRQDELKLEGKFELADTASGQNFSLQADIDILKPNLEAPEKKMDLISADRFRIKSLELDGQPQFKAKTITADGLEIGRGKTSSQHKDQDAAFFRAGQLLVNNISYTDGSASIDTIHEEDVHVLYHRGKDGNWRINTLLGVLLGEDKAPGENTTEATKVTAGETEETRLVINRIDASDGSTMTIVDEAVTPAFKETLTFSKLSLEKLDTGKPDQVSVLTVDSKLGKYTRLSASGSVKPFQQPPGLDLEGKLYAMDLPRLSPYTRDSLGVLLDSGTLDVDLKIKSENSVMGGEAILKLHQLELESTGSKDSLQSSIPVPLNVALDTLRDRNNTIELSIPFEGDANNPDFDVSDAVRQAFAAGLKKGAVSYLKYALQPYGALILAAEYAGEAATRVRLKSIEFKPGQSDMDDTDRDYLSKVAQVLHDRPKLAIKLCGVAVKQDALFFQQQDNPGRKKNDKEDTAKEPVIDSEKLTALAGQRAAQVKNYLVETFKVPADHLVGCRPRIETADADAAARTDLLI